MRERHRSCKESVIPSRIQRSIALIQTEFVVRYVFVPCDSSHLIILPDSTTRCYHGGRAGLVSLMTADSWGSYLCSVANISSSTN
jgi:hypothetical protein